MSTRYKVHDPEGAYFFTMTTVGWLDVFTRKAYKDILIDSLRFCQKNKGLQIFGYVIMSNHLHLIAQTGKEANLVNVLGDFKKYTARRIIDAIQQRRESRREWLLYQLKWFAKLDGRGQTYKLWQSDNHPIIVYSPKIIWQKLNYIHMNPVVAGIVVAPEHYLYSSALNYAGKDGILEVSLIDLASTEGYIFFGG